MTDHQKSQSILNGLVTCSIVLRGG